MAIASRNRTPLYEVVLSTRERAQGPTWEFSKIRRPVIQMPNNRALIRRTPAKRTDPKIVEAATSGSVLGQVVENYESKLLQCPDGTSEIAEEGGATGKGQHQRGSKSQGKQSRTSGPKCSKGPKKLKTGNYTSSAVVVLSRVISLGIRNQEKRPQGPTQ